MVIHEFCSCGFPHSEICGSKDACSSPQLIAACHVLHRLEVPRHPPCALSSLTIKFTHEQQTLAVIYRRLHSKTCLVCFFLSDFTNTIYLFVKSDNSHYSIFKELKLLSTKCRNFNIQRAHMMNSRSSFVALNTQVSIDRCLVEVRGFEPLTPALQTRCSAN